MNIFITEPENYSQKAVSFYKSVGTVLLGSTGSLSESEIEVLVIRLKTQVSEDFLDRYRNLKFIITPTTGLTHIDLDACKVRHITVCSLRDCQNDIREITSTSELAMGLILAILRGIPAANSSVTCNYEWSREKFLSREMSALTLGLIGLGRVGGHVAKYAHIFGMRVMAFDPYQKQERFDRFSVECASLEDVLRSADLISVHASYEDGNYHLLGEKELRMMKKEAALVNTARGELIDEQAVYNALSAQAIAGVAVDVLQNENDAGLLKKSPLIRAAREGLNMIITPHIGGCTTDAMHKTEEIIAQHFIYSVL